MSSIYPNSIDGYAQLPLVIDTVTQINSDTINRLRSAIINIETELGVAPSGSSQTVGVRLDLLSGSLTSSDIDIAELTMRVSTLETKVTDIETILSPSNIAGAVIIEDGTGIFTNRRLISADIDGLSSSYKEPCRVATTGNINLSAAPSNVDGIALSADDRILVSEQTILSENGIYKVSVLGTGSNGVWIRANDFDDTSDIIQAGAFTYIQEGSINGRTNFTLVTSGTIIIGTTNIEFIGGSVIMRSDLIGTDVIGSSGTPTTLSVADTYVSQSGVTNTRDYDSAVWYVTVTNKGTATSMTVKIDWLEDSSNLGPQGTEDILSGSSTLSIYEASYDISSLTAPFNLPVIPLNVIGPEAKISLKSNLGTTTTTYARVWRKA